MASTKFTWRRLAIAMGLGLALEAILLLTAILIGSETLGDWMQAPASLLVRGLAKLTHPGFEEQVAYVLLIPLLQWFLYTTLIYLFLVSRAEKPVQANISKENAHLL